jgi:hypothetical protein
VIVGHIGTGGYLVNLGQGISHCAAIADQGGVPIFTTPGANTGAARGNGARVDIFSASANLAPGFPTADTVGVETFRRSALNDSSFYLAVFC